MRQHYARPWRSRTHGQGSGLMGLRLRSRRRAGGLTRSASLISGTDCCGDRKPIEGRRHRQEPPLHSRGASFMSLGTTPTRCIVFRTSRGPVWAGTWTQMASRRRPAVLPDSLTTFLSSLIAKRVIDAHRLIVRTRTDIEVKRFLEYHSVH